MLWLALEFPHLVLDAMQVVDGVRGDVARGDDVRDGVARGDVARGNVARGGVARGDVAHGDVARGDAVGSDATPATDQREPTAAHEVAQRDTANETPPIAIVDHQQQRRLVFDCNAAARAHGVHAGQPLGAAQALCGALRLVPRSIARERELILRRATWAFRFSPVVSVRDDRLLLVEIDPSRRLFGGLRALLARIRGELDEAGYQYRASAAPTPAAAVLLARAGQSRVLAGERKIEAVLGDIALAHGECDERTLKALHGIGLARFRELFALPRRELGRRFGQALVDYCDRLLGRRVEVLPRFEPPDTFATGMELPAPISHTEALAFGANRLLRELGDWLEARQLAVLRCRLELVHEDHPPSLVDIGLRRATADTTHLLALLRTHLERLVLPQAVDVLRLAAVECTSIAAPNGELFERADADDEDIERLIDRLRSRLGADGVQQIALRADHRPERAQLLVPDLARSARTRVATEAHPASDAHETSDSPRADHAPWVTRPLLLLDAPRPLADVCEAPFETLSLTGPERIESGWWDGHSVRRDYFRAVTPEGTRYWIYRDRLDESWFVHGVFG